MVPREIRVGRREHSKHDASDPRPSPGKCYNAKETQDRRNVSGEIRQRLRKGLVPAERIEAERAEKRADENTENARAPAKQRG
jgi:hypothetical protein